MTKRNVPQGFISRREEFGLTPEQVAEAIGVSPRTVRYWETGERIPNLSPRQTKLLFRLLKITATKFAAYFEPDSLAA